MKFDYVDAFTAEIQGHLAFLRLKFMLSVGGVDLPSPSLKIELKRHESEDQSVRESEQCWTVKPIYLATDRLTIRPFEKADVSPKYLSWLNDAQHMRYSNQRFQMHTTESALKYLASFDQIGSVFLAIELKDRGYLVGTTTVVINDRHGVADIGIMIGPEYSGQGIAREAICAITESLESQAFRKITIGTSAQNHGMLHVVASLGFKPDGIRVKQELIGETETDILYFAKFPHSPKS